MTGAQSNDHAAANFSGGSVEIEHRDTGNRKSRTYKSELFTASRFEILSRQAILQRKKADPVVCPAGSMDQTK